MSLWLACLLLSSVLGLTASRKRTNYADAINKRTEEYPTYAQIQETSLERFKIRSTDCVFEAVHSSDVPQCIKNHRILSGSCTLQPVLAQLFPDVDIALLTNNFVAPSKLFPSDVSGNGCTEQSESGTLTIKTKQREPFDVVPSYMTLASEADVQLSWKFKEPGMQNLKVYIAGTTSIGNNYDKNVKMESQNGKQFKVELQLSTLTLVELFNHFHIDIQSSVNSELTFERQQLGLDALTFNNPKLHGLVSPESGFEFTVEGTAAGTELSTDASKVFAVIQDFKKNYEAGAGRNPQAVGAVLALYQDEQMDRFIYSLTGVTVPNLPIFQNVKEIVISLATEEVYSFNTAALQNALSKYIPEEGLQVLTKGLSIIHLSQNTNSDIKNQKNEVVKSLLYRCDISKSKLTWETPMIIETSLDNLKNLLTSDGNSMRMIPISSTTKTVLVSVELTRPELTLQLNFNLSEPVKVMPSGIVTLRSSTMTLFSRSVSSLSSVMWNLKGAGNEVVLDERVEVTVSKKKRRVLVEAEVNIFSIKTIYDRLKVKPLPEDKLQMFPFLSMFPIKSLNFVVSFREPTLLRLTGTVTMEEKSSLEIIYHTMTNGDPGLKIGMLFQKAYLHKIINEIYGETVMKTAWMKFATIAILMKLAKNRSGHAKFSKRKLNVADRATDTGIGVVADRLILKKCGAWKICNFLSMYNGVPRQKKSKLRGRFIGRIGRKKLDLEASINWPLKLGEATSFVGNKAEIIVGQKGDFFRLSGKVTINAGESAPREEFSGRIRATNENTLMLRFGTESDESNTLLGLGSITMKPVKASFQLPLGPLELIVFRSPLKIGNSESNHIMFTGGRQHVKPSSSGVREVRFVGIFNSEVSHGKILSVVGYSASPFAVLQEAKFAENVVVGYSSMDGMWYVPEYNVNVRKGFYFFGKLTLRSQETYNATIKVLDGAVQTTLHLKPMKFGKVTEDERKRKSFKGINAFITRAKNAPEQGPDLTFTSSEAELKGYCSTIGVEDEISAKTSDNTFIFHMTGSVYGQTYKNTLVRMRLDLANKISEPALMYNVFLTIEARKKVKLELEYLLEDFANIVDEKRGAAEEAVKSTTELKDHYEHLQGQHLETMLSIQQQILDINVDFDKSLLDISHDCTTKCQTASVPSIEKHECDENDFGCFSWVDSGQKVVNVMCILKCEAQKFASASAASSEQRRIRTLANRYKETKQLHANIQPLLAYAEQALSHATIAKNNLLENSDMLDDIKVLQQNEDPSTPKFALNSITSQVSNVEDMKPPCLTFSYSYTINIDSSLERESVSEFCFNGEFFANIAAKILRDSFPSIDKFYKATEEAELFFSKIKNIRNVMETIKQGNAPSSKRSDMVKQEKDLAQQKMTKIAKRRIPKFTVKGDRTVMAFKHYSPWATAKRSQFAFMKYNTAQNKSFDVSSLRGQTGCFQARRVLTEYKKIADSIGKASENYKHGKQLFEKNKIAAMKDLADSHDHLMKLMNGTKLSSMERSDMMYWYEYTKQGMGNYLHTFRENVEQQNLQSLPFLRQKMESFYGQEDFIGHLENLNRKALKRSNTPSSKQEEHTASLNHLGKKLKSLLFENGIKVDDAGAVIKKLSPQIEKLGSDAMACY